MVLVIRTASPLPSASLPLLISSRPHLSLSKAKTPFFPRTTRYFSLHSSTKMNWLGKIGFGTTIPTESSMVQSNSSSIAQGADDDIPRSGQQFAQFGAGCFWGVELAFQRVPGVTTTEVGYTQGHLHNPTYNDVCSKTTNHSEVVRVQYDPKECDYGSLLDVFWARHDPTTLNRQVRFSFS